MRLLAIETSTEACSVAVLVDGAVHERFELAPRRHAERVLPWAEALLAEAGLRRSALHAIAVGRGPGAFTGVRLGISIAQGIALALDRPLVPVSTLAVLALGGLRGVDGRSGAGPRPGDRVLAAIDARMGEVYAGAFVAHGAGVRALGPEAVAGPDTIVLPEAAVPPNDERWIGVGTGFAAADGALAQRLGKVLASVDPAALPRAADLARLGALAFAAGEAVAPELAEPAYLRNNVALNLAEQAAAREARG